MSWEHILFRLSALGLGAAALVGYVWRVEPRWLRVRRLTLAVPDLPSAFEGYRMVHLSDVHLGVRQNERALPKVIHAVQREQADLIAITGDFATGRCGNWVDSRGLLAQFDAPDGVWAVLGNHDYYSGPRRVGEVLAEAGIGLLRNMHHVVARGNDRLVLAGVDNMICAIPDVDRALDGAPPEAPVVLLAHEPDFARIAARDERVTLQLSGHTHGGQVRVPGIRPLFLPKFGRLFPFGTFHVGSLALYVTTGTGTGRFVIRFNCRPEIAVITLVRADDGHSARWLTV